MVTAANKLEQEEDDGGGLFSGHVRPNATVGQLLNLQSEKGVQLSNIKSKMSEMMASMRRDKERGEAALAKRIAELEAENRALRAAAAVGAA